MIGLETLDCAEMRLAMSQQNLHETYEIRQRPRIVIIGGGFGGLAAARALGRVNAQVTLIDRNNHHLFQPLLYQVATADLSPADITAPIRNILRKQINTET